MTGPLPAGRSRPSDSRTADAWDTAHDRLVESLRDLIRIPSINPPDPPGGDGELVAARYLAAALTDAGLRPEVFEPEPGRGSVVARLRGDGSGGAPLLLLSHLDVVPAPPERWTHEPFGGDVAEGYVYGRGAVDMKDLAAMELEVVRLLAEEARAAGRDPAADPVPGLRRDILFASTADEEAGGLAGAGWLAASHPEHLRAAGAINEAGGVAVDVGGTRLYPIQVAEKGYAVYRITVHGVAGHGSMPRPDNAVVLVADAIDRLSRPGPVRVTPTMRAFFEGAADAVGGDFARAARGLAGGDTRAVDLVTAGLCVPTYARASAAVLRDTFSPNVVHAGLKYNVIPGEAVLEVDCRTLPGTTEEEMHDAIVDRLGPELAARSDVDLVIAAGAVEASADDALYRELAAAIVDHDPLGVPLAVMAPFATDAKHLVELGVPTYGFSPLRQPPEETYLDRYHGVDERVSLAGLRWGLPVLYDAVKRFCG
ncbi:MAG TPA: M20/M25/M40 family metallo-hydrolase [Candidatus Eisenbacteria bacterium]|nr:M20/M25/M40 family metallo-hydrolase [Candidatus Eisenbacteria bacterium]